MHLIFDMRDTVPKLAGAGCHKKDATGQRLSALSYLGVYGVEKSG